MELPVSVPDYGELILNCLVNYSIFSARKKCFRPRLRGTNLKLASDLAGSMGGSGGFRPRLRGTNLKHTDSWRRLRYHR